MTPGELPEMVAAGVANGNRTFPNIEAAGSVRCGAGIFAGITHLRARAYDFRELTKVNVETSKPARAHDFRDNTMTKKAKPPIPSGHALIRQTIPGPDGTPVVVSERVVDERGRKPAGALQAKFSKRARKKLLNLTRKRVPCGATRHSDGQPCEALSEPGKKRCRFHGGRSTGPKTPEGKAKSLANLRLGMLTQMDRETERIVKRGLAKCRAPTG